MLALVASAGFIAFGALFLGQFILRLCGTPRWTWTAAPIGVVAMMLIAIPALHTPGRAKTTAVVLLVAVAVSVVVTLRSPAHRPPLVGLFSGLPVAAMAAIPFLSTGTAGTLGWSFNNDMATHLLWADGYREDVVTRFHPLPADYPLGPHALVASLSEAFGAGTDEVFAGLTVASVLLLGWAALAMLRSPRLWAYPVTTTLVAFPSLVAGYYGQGSFKEILQAVFVLSMAILLANPPEFGRAQRWIPAAILLTGSLSVYSFLGASWPLAFLGLWLAVTGVRRLLQSRSLRVTLREGRAGLGPVLIGVGVLAVILIPQMPRLKAFIEFGTSSENGTGIDEGDLGNLAGRLPVWEAFGIWGNPDYRFAPVDQLTAGAWAGGMLALIAFGAAWAIRRGEWMLVAATATTFLIWVFADRSQSPYVAAKALVLLSPLLMLVALRPIVERRSPGFSMPSWWWLGAPVLATLLIIRVGGSSWDALRISHVGPTSHARQLQALEPMLNHRPTLFLGNDDFVRWELSSTPVNGVVISFQTLPTRPEKPWSYGTNIDLDSVESATLNQFDWVITPRDAAASAPPPELKVARRTRDFVLYQRTAPIPPRAVLDQGDTATGELNCRSAAGQRVVASGGVAAIREPNVAAPLPNLGPGQSFTASLPLPAGAWDLVSPYGGQRPVDVTAPGLKTELPAHLDRPGTRWPIGRIVVRGSAPTPVTFRVDQGRWAHKSQISVLGSVIAVPVKPVRMLPLASACGKLVDWYRPGEQR